MRGGCRTFWSALALMLIAPAVMAADDGLATAYSRLQQAAAAPGPIHVRNEQLRRLYAASVAPQQTVGHAATATPADLATLYDAAGFMATTVRDTAYLRDMQLDLSELQRRKLDTDAVYQSMYGALVITRRFPEATTLARRHRSAKLDVLPRLVESADLRKSGPTELAFSPDGKTLTRQHVNLGKGTSMVIIGGPSDAATTAAISAIEADPKLSTVLRGKITLVATPTPTLDAPAFLKWNATHPTTPMTLVYRESEWTMITHWTIPTFYVLDRGKVVAVIQDKEPEAVRQKIAAALAVPHPR
ncbi:hypothetical protein [Pinirhizobacter soli]|uniref:hypothetical protein n=1 Tax=Pinirhizobacter soli TaxID=2786953 RepID=UPI00202A4CB3|nr:hypothetical protein [Pinirhizobacter soli]